MCVRHGARAPRAAANAAIRRELAAWGLDAPTADPGETLLRLVSQSAARVSLYSSLLAAAYAGADDFPERFKGSGVAALIGHRYVVSNGDRMEVAEAVRGLSELESQERDRCARFCGLAIDKGLDERRVRLAERQIDTLELVLRAALERAGLDAGLRTRVIDAVPVVLAELVGPDGSRMKEAAE